VRATNTYMCSTVPSRLQTAETAQSYGQENHLKYCTNHATTKSRPSNNWHLMAAENIRIDARYCSPEVEGDADVTTVQYSTYLP